MGVLKKEIKERVGYLTFNKPDKRNALSQEMIGALKTELENFEKDDQVKVIVIKGEGKAFSAGADLDELQKSQQKNFQQNLEDATHLSELFRKIYQHKKIVIAQVEGAAIAGGCGLASVCDFAFAVPEAKFGYTEVRIGFVPAMVMAFLIRKLGETRSKELLLSGAIIDAVQAKSYNLINDVIEPEHIEKYVFDFAMQLCKQNSGEAMYLTKKMLGRIQDHEFESALKWAAEMNAKARNTEDCKKGIQTFLNKEKPEW